MKKIWIMMLVSGTMVAQAQEGKGIKDQGKQDATKPQTATLRTAGNPAPAVVQDAPAVSATAKPSEGKRTYMVLTFSVEVKTGYLNIAEDKSSVLSLKSAVASGGNDAMASLMNKVRDEGVTREELLNTMANNGYELAQILNHESIQSETYVFKLKK